MNRLIDDPRVLLTWTRAESGRDEVELIFNSQRARDRGQGKRIGLRNIVIEQENGQTQCHRHSVV